MFLPKEHVVVLANINLLILHIKTFKQFLGLVHVLGHLVTRRKNLANQIHELFVTINRECKLGLDWHQSGHEFENGHIGVPVKRLFWCFEEVEELLNLRCRWIMMICGQFRLQILKHLVHPINIFIVINFYFYCSFKTW
jgi:hypothetical protein